MASDAPLVTLAARLAAPESGSAAAEVLDAGASRAADAAALVYGAGGSGGCGGNGSDDAAPRVAAGEGRRVTAVTDAPMERRSASMSRRRDATVARGGGVHMAAATGGNSGAGADDDGGAGGAAAGARRYGFGAGGLAGAVFRSRPTSCVRNKVDASLSGARAAAAGGRTLPPTDSAVGLAGRLVAASITEAKSDAGADGDDGREGGRERGGEATAPLSLGGTPAAVRRDAINAAISSAGVAAAGGCLCVASSDATACRPRACMTNVSSAVPSHERC